MLGLTGCSSDDEALPVAVVNLPAAPGNGDDNLTIERAELIVNGSFEEGHDLGNNSWSVFDELPGWKADLEMADAPIEVQNGLNIGGISPSNGTAKIELDSHNKNGYSESDAVVYQMVDGTVDGQPYLLRFDYSPRVNNHGTSSVVEVYWDGNLIEELDAQEVNWQEYAFEVIGTGEPTRLEFRAIIDNDTLGGYIDNVSLY